MITVLFVLLQSGPTAAAAAPRTIEGHVRDAFTGGTLEGARVELFTENMFGEPELVAEVSTGADGRYRLEDRDSRGEKVRVRHPRYRSTLDEASTDEFVLFPRDEPCELLLLDLEGQPIAGATVEFRQTCHHALPTTSGESDVAGRVSLPDLPPLVDNGELSVSAPGYSVLENLEPSELAPRATLYLPRRKPVRLRLLDENGCALAPGTCCYESGQSSYALVPDALGRVTLAALFERNDAGVKRAGSFAHEIPPAGDDLYTLRFVNPGRGPDPARLQVSLDLPREEAKLVPLTAFHDDGYVWQGLLEGRELPPGAWHLVLGQPFSGYRETILPLQLAPGEKRVLEPALEREPRLRVLLPPGFWTVHVQVGEDSVSRFVKDGELETGVPPGAAVIVLAQDREVRRARHAPWSGELELDLRDASTLAEPAPAPAPPFELSLRARTASGDPIETEASAVTRGKGPEDEDQSPDGVRFRFPAGARYEVCLQAEGHVPIYRAGIAPAGGAAFEDVVLPRE